MLFIRDIKLEYKKVLIIEKEAIIDTTECNGRLLVSGKGFPCRNTLSFLKFITCKYKYIILESLTDLDPHGLLIHLKYIEEIPKITRIGLSCEDLLKNGVDKHQCIPLTENDKNILKKLIKDNFVKEEAKFIEGFGYKFELNQNLL
ncbi:SPO11 [Hepatospora eriocheir]|uniref:SPO11 n=1 Tax=Hepatospora eriocheir TaxID=1081669 RepID=A0A1X0QAW9_9MICR|nr:SPO11 [Hepatospora eriocheir]